MFRKNFSVIISFPLILVFIYFASHFYNDESTYLPADSLIFNSDVVALNGMVSSASSYASEVGVEILKSGGNSIDAAVAMGFVLAVTYPQAGNIGGGGFMVLRTKDNLITTIDFREKAPLSSFRDMFLDAKGEYDPDKSQIGYLSVGVPGSVAGLLFALEKFGTMSREQVLNPAINLARNGFVIEQHFASSLSSNFALFNKFNSTKKIFTKNGKKYKSGDLFIQRDLAATLERIRDQGRDGFYKGETANLIVDEMKRGSGLITLEDLENYSSVERNPLHTVYKGYDIYSMAPPSSGGIALIQLLNMLENYKIPNFNDTLRYITYVHFMTECMKRVYADRSEYLGDPDFYDVPVQDLINKNYSSERIQSITDAATPTSEIKPGLQSYYKESDQTTHYSVIDKAGNMVSVTTTLNNTYGSFVVVDGAGFLLNDEMDDFASKPGVPNMFGLIGSEANSIQPNKRMLSSMTPTIILKDGKPFMIVGSPGGGKIITTVFQTIVNVIDFNLPLNEAIDKPRFHHQWLPEYIQVEEGLFDNRIIKMLNGRGHTIKQISDFGRVDGILIDWDKHIYYGHTDRRGYGLALGY